MILSIEDRLRQIRLVDQLRGLGISVNDAQRAAIELGLAARVANLERSGRDFVIQEMP